MNPHADRVILISSTASKPGHAMLAGDVIADYKVRGRRSLEKLEDVLKHLTAGFDNRRAQSVTATDVRAYVAKRLEAGAASATINRELAALKRMFRLGINGERIYRAPHIEMLPEANARQGFVEPATFEKILAALPDVLADAERMLYGSGWRKQEVLSLRWSDVDREHRRVTLRAENSKNAEPRVLPLVNGLLDVIERRWAARTFKTEDGQERVSDLVFHRDGQRIRGFRKAWASATKAAGSPELLVHDLRRSAVRNMTKAGVPQAVAMKITGHRTASVFRRYLITDEVDLREALERTDVAVRAASVPATRKVVQLPRKRRA